MSTPDPPLAPASFHAQQTAEKALKALLTRFESPFGKTHELQVLADAAERVSPGIQSELIDLDELTLFAVGGRYPGGPRRERDEVARHVALASSTLATVRRLLQPYLDSEPSAT
jgi:HEPN domain-containing protein